LPDEFSALLIRVLNETPFCLPGCWPKTAQAQWRCHLLRNVIAMGGMAESLLAAMANGVGYCKPCPAPDEHDLFYLMNPRRENATSLLWLPSEPG